MDPVTFHHALQGWFDPAGRVGPPQDRTLPFWSLRDTSQGASAPSGPLQQVQNLVAAGANPFVSTTLPSRTLETFGAEWPIETLMFRGNEGDVFEGNSTRVALVEQMLESSWTPPATTLNARRVLPWRGIGYPLSWIHLAAMLNDVNVLPLMHQRGMDLHLADPQGRTLLHLMTSHPVCLQWLIETVGLDVKSKNKAGQTALHTAAGTQGAAGGVHKLLQAGADAKARDKKGSTPLHLATSLEVACFLVENGARLEILDKRGRSPLDVWSDASFKADDEDAPAWRELIEGVPQLRSLALACSLPQPTSRPARHGATALRHRF